MIFVTVGTQLPFDRLIRAVDSWASERNRSGVFAQIGPASYRPVHIEWAEFVSTDECQRRMEEATAIVAHAGMGTILSALELGKPLLVMPRRAELQEHRNDHQLATAQRLLAQRRINVAFDEAELIAQLDNIEQLGAAARIPGIASEQLVVALRNFIEHGRLPSGSSDASTTQGAVTS